MKRAVHAALFAALVAVGSSTIVAQSRGSQPPSPTAPRIQVCSLLSKEEVKKHLPWRPLLDQFPAEEEAIGATGSSCNYPSVFIQVMPYSQRTIDIAQAGGGLEPVSGIGDQAFYHNNRNTYGELYVRVGQRQMTLQANIEAGKEATVKPGILSLARVLVAKLR